MTPKILLTRRWPEVVERALAGRYDVTLSVADAPLSSLEWSEAITTYDVICPTITDKIDRSVLSQGGMRTRAFCNFGAGLDHIDLGACTEAGVIVTNTPDVLTDDTADMAILLAAMCARRAGEGERLIRGGGWQGWHPTHMMGQSLSGKTMGIVGAGRIGRATARRARLGFRMEIIYTSRSGRRDAEMDALGGRAMGLEDLLQCSDIVSLHAPGGEATRGMIDRYRLAMMKPSAILVNTARGDLVDEPALADALAKGRLAAAGLDVYRDEPRVFPGLSELENVVLLPHLGSATVETRIAMGMRALANVDAIMTGQVPPDQVR
ncbi:D-glycerate dehydrogenase [Novosphingobium sp. SG707]|uniref:2-hydroxyacid dehydrogenase n=1 Tax=Novosphingobium sp. SG707 TaxID=2586996 RepID=UPI0014474136|nr:D-glycerate dehydrogenase [Novosphingobium sp. SG707]NKJ00951.1 lactate dehydrogenase-like 2-hydroxyacid dehydrogenase [Novosphingobium sp. SG707]